MLTKYSTGIYILLGFIEVSRAIYFRTPEFGDPVFDFTVILVLPEDGPVLPLVQKALDKPDPRELDNLRRENISAGKGRDFT